MAQKLTLNPRGFASVGGVMGQQPPQPPSYKDILERLHLYGIGGLGESDRDALLSWCRSRGYSLEEVVANPGFYAQQN